MKTFNEFYKKNEVDTLIEQLTQIAQEKGVSDADLIGSVIEEMMIQSDDPKFKQELALYALELQEDFGSSVGSFAGRAVNAVGRFGKTVATNATNAYNAYQQARTPQQQQNLQNPQTPPPLNPQQQQQAQQKRQQDITQILKSLSTRYGIGAKDYDVDNIFRGAIDQLNKLTQQRIQSSTRYVPSANAASTV